MPRIITIIVDGSSYTLDPSKIGVIADINQGMINVASEISFHGSLLGNMERREIEMDAAYRQWRAQSANAQLAADPKQAEWKVKAIIEAAPEFMDFKQKIAQIQEAKTTLLWVCRALESKSELLRSMGANQRSEMAATGMTTKTHVDKKPNNQRKRVD